MDTTTQYLILGLVVSVLANVVILLTVFATGIGKRVVQRLRQRWLYKKGSYVNCLWIGNNHVAKEFFVSKEADGSFKIHNKIYTVNPMSTFILDGIPTQVNLEGITEPYNIFNSDIADAMSTAEIEKVIMNNEGQGLTAILKKYFILAVILVIVIVLFAGVSAYFNYNIFDMLVQNPTIAQAFDIVKNTAEVGGR
jgi:hypothetical protein